MATKAITAASARAVDALQQVVSEPSTEHARHAAETLVALRKQFRHEGITDWAGRSAGYRDLVERLYRQAGVPSDSESNLQANLRYHLGNVLRKVAPPEDLAALGMSVDGPLARIKSTRAAAPRRPRQARATTFSGITDPAALAELALAAVRTISAMEANLDAACDSLQALLDETAEVLDRRTA